jgi:hypothetical protein
VHLGIQANLSKECLIAERAPEHEPGRAPTAHPGAGRLARRWPR